jgi:hypothetical protein
VKKFNPLLFSFSRILLPLISFLFSLNSVDQFLYIFRDNILNVYWREGGMNEKSRHVEQKENIPRASSGSLSQGFYGMTSLPHVSLSLLSPYFPCLDLNIYRESQGEINYQGSQQGYVLLLENVHFDGE